jgi:hypothetical protein
MGLWDNIVDYFASNTYVVATEGNVSSNPLEKSIESLNGRYSLGNTPIGDYIKFGAGDDFSIILEKMFKQSPVHSGIVTKKSKMVSGRNIDYNIDAYKTPAKQAEIKAFIANCAGKSEGLYSQIVHAAFQYELHGAFAFYVKWNQDHTKLVEFRSLDIKGVRAAEPVNGKITHYIVRRRFGNMAASMQDNAPIKVKAFDKYDKTREQIIYVKNPYSGNSYYGIPNYISAFHFINADFEFGKHIRNSAANSFTPKVLATFIGRNMSNEQKREEYEKFKASFVGSEAEPVIVSWVKSKDEAPEFKALDVNNLDKTVDILARLNDSKILTAHNVTSPTLFGVMVAGKLGGTGNELVTAYQIFRATETLPNRQMLMDAINRVLSTVNYEKIELSIIEEQINLEAIKGAHTTDITQPKNNG